MFKFVFRSKSFQLKQKLIFGFWSSLLLSLSSAPLALRFFPSSSLRNTSFPVRHSIFLFSLCPEHCALHFPSSSLRNSSFPVRHSIFLFPCALRFPSFPLWSIDHGLLTFSYPTLPSRLICSSFCASTANSMGNWLITSRA